MTEEEKEQNGQIPPKVKPAQRNGGKPPVEGKPAEESTPPEAKSVSGPKADTSRADIPEQKTDSSEAANTEREETMRVVLPKADQVETGTLRQRSEQKPKKTVKLKRSGPGQEQTEAKAPETVVEGKPMSGPKQETSRIDLSKAQAAPTEEQVETARKNDTMQVVLDEATGGADPKQTVKIDREKGATETSGGGADKAETAKIDLPEESGESSEGRKTIKIKRPKTSTGEGKTLKLSRPEVARTGVAQSPAPERDGAEDSRPHAIFALAALIAVIVSGVLVYLMCTQMPFGAELPWPGKIVAEDQVSSEMS